MANYQKVNTSDINGLFVYHVKNQCIHYDWLTKTGYVITNDAAGTYSVTQSKGAIALFLGAIVYIFTSNLLYSFIAAFTVFLGISLYMRFVFFKKLPSYPNFKKPQRDNYFVASAKRLSFKRIYFIFILACLLTVLLVLNIIYQNTTTIELVLLIILTIVSAAITIMALYTYTIKRINKY